MEREFIPKLQKLVSKEAAITLREIGFNQFCDCYYHTDNDEPDDYEMAHEQVCNDSFEEYHARVAAPYVCDALLWLMRKKNVSLLVDFFPNKSSETGISYQVELHYSHNGEIKCAIGVDTDYQAALRDAIDVYFNEI